MPVAFTQEDFLGVFVFLIFQHKYVLICIFRNQYPTQRLVYSNMITLHILSENFSDQIINRTNEIITFTNLSISLVDLRLLRCYTFCSPCFSSGRK